MVLLPWLDSDPSAHSRPLNISSLTILFGWAAAARSRRQGTNTCVHLFRPARSQSPQNTTSTLVPAQISGHSCSWKFHRSRRGEIQNTFICFCLCGFAHFDLFLKYAQQPSHSLSTRRPETPMFIFLRFKRVPVRMKDNWQKAKDSCHWIWI